MEIIPVWKKVTPELASELIAMWARNHALPDPTKAAERAQQAVAVGRGESGALWGVGTAGLGIVPSFGQPTYLYRQFFDVGARGLKQTMPFLNSIRDTLEAYNASVGFDVRMVREDIHAQAGEAFKVAVESAQCRAVLDGQCGQMRIGYQVTATSGSDQQARQHRGMTIGRMQQTRAWMVQPCIHLAQCLIQRQRVREDSAPCRDAHEAEQRDPGESDAARFVVGLFKPARGDGLLCAVGIDGVEQDVDIGCSHGRYRARVS